MEKYSNSRIWMKTLGLEGQGEIEQNGIDSLKQSYKNTREKIVQLAGEIGKDMPNYTVHDISHIDALWESADIILPENYEINPVEGYVLGMAFLIHDLGMGMIAYKNGLAEIQKMDIWKDIVATELRKRGKNTDISDVDKVDTDIKDFANKITLRKLHAEQATRILTIEWEFEGKKEYLIDEVKFRDAYGEIIGLIAYSHWWGAETVKMEFMNKYLGALSSFPATWTVDVLKLACILRIVDAIQIDDRRAPIFLMKLRKPIDVSRLHWIFQSKLYQPIVQNERVLYTSKSAFELEEMEAWWTCYDTLQMIDEELKKVDTILVETGHQRFNASGVCGISVTHDLARHIRTNGWTPIDTKLKVGDVGKLVKTLGGKQLYGDDVMIPIREMIQNGADAIRARRIIENDNDYSGDITVHLLNEGDNLYIIFEDNGVGMSQNVLTGPFLDFGQSFWNTQLMYEELSGLSANGFESTGQYGIGFYSVFMWSSNVTVITRRYDAAREDTLVLEFREETLSRPTLRKAKVSEQIKSGGTKVVIKVTSELITEILEKNSIKEKFADIIAKYCPCLDCNLWVKEGEKSKIIDKDDWLQLAPIDFLKRLLGPNHFAKLPAESKKDLEEKSINMEIIQEDGVIYGRAFLYRGSNGYFSAPYGHVLVGGFATTTAYGIGGVLIGKCTRASREESIPIIPRRVLEKWVQKQMELLIEANISPAEQLNYSDIIVSLGVKPDKICIAEYRNGALKYEELVEMVRKGEHNEYIIVDETDMFIALYDLPTEFKIEYFENVLWCKGTSVLFSSIGVEGKWPFESREEMQEYNIADMVIKAILEAWDIQVVEADKHVLGPTEDNICTAGIGKIEGKEWKMNYVIKVCKNEIQENVASQN